ncbi:S-layer homology domain-containing protein [Paenibacillus glycanilyticus]|uniref:S-layer homology domain-containing protein n=1 Tax=Paenibacillus glycanilyticus TaxID=126569 RepID=UPI00203BFEC8|nr:S-layer homology domain-containing protein [Paenibacillus glycanilyticus]MCM3630975.1 S-layer homology domain-containing protein [Paenibacillus glycanilyticus]
MKKFPSVILSAVLAGTLLFSSFSTSALASAEAVKGISTSVPAQVDLPNGSAPAEAGEVEATSPPPVSTPSAGDSTDGQLQTDMAPEPVSLVVDTEVDNYLTVDDNHEVHLKQLFSDGTSVDVTQSAEWTSNDESVATVSKSGSSDNTAVVIHAAAAGDTVVTATYNNDAPVSFWVSVSEKPLPDETLDIVLNSERVKLKEGGFYQLSATRRNISLIRNDVTTQGEWLSLDPSIATVTAEGLIQAKKLGETYIHFKYEDLTYTVQVNVIDTVGLTASEDSVEIMPNDGTNVSSYIIFNDNTKSDITTQAVWTVKDPEIANVDTGVIFGLSEGETTVTVSYESFTYDIAVSVTNNPKEPILLGLSVNQPSYTLGRTEKSEPMVVTGVFSNGTTKDVTDEIEWEVGNILISVENNAIVATDAGFGASLVMATYMNRSVYVPVYVKQDAGEPPVETHIFTSLEVTPEVTTMQVNETRDLHVEGIYNFGSDPAKNFDITDLALYTSLNPDILSVSPDGKLTALKEGKATITIYGLSFTKSLTIDVTSGVTVASSGIVPFKQMTGLVLDENQVKLEPGSSHDLNARAHYNDGSSDDATQASSWVSLNQNVVSVKDGVLTPVGKGKTEVLVHYGSFSEMIEVAVGIDDGLPSADESHVDVFYQPAHIVVQPTGLYPARLQAALSDGRIVDVTELSENDPVAGLAATEWGIADDSIATVSQGKVKGVALGETTATVQYGDYPALDIPVTVQSEPGDVVLVGIWIEDIDLLISRNTQEPAHRVFAEYSNHRIVEVNDQGRWSTSEPSIATVDSHGNVETYNEFGIAYVKFEYDEPRQETPLNDQMFVRVVTPSSLATFDGATEYTLPAKTEHQTIIQMFYEGVPRVSPAEVQDNGDWTSSDESVATITDFGLILAQSPGTAVITISYMGLKLDLTITVTDPIVDPDPAPIVSTYASPGYVIESVGSEVKPTITAMFSDGTFKDVTSKVNWLASSAKVTDVQNGVIKANSRGAAVIGAEYHGDLVIIPVVVKAGTSGGGTNPPTTPSNPGTPTPPPANPDAGKPSLIEGVDAVKLKTVIEQALANTAPVAYKDVATQAWSTKAITLASHIGFVNGYSDNTFHPEANVTRAELVTMLARVLGLNDGKGAAAFSDVSSTSFAANAINNLHALGLINGYGDGTFKPNQVITRAEVATILAKAVSLTSASSAGKFADVNGHWAEDAINSMAEQGILKGKGANLFAPDANTSREEAVVLVLRTLGKALELDLKL